MSEFDGDDDLLDEFVTESLDSMTDIDDELMSIECDGDAEPDGDIVNKVFRTIHSIKGAAGFLGLDVVQALTHVVENVLSRVRAGDIQPTADIVDKLLSAVDRVRSLLENIATSNAEDVSEHVSNMERILAVANGETVPEESEEAPVTEESSEASEPDSVAETPAVNEAVPAAPTDAPEEAVDNETEQEDAAPTATEPVADVATEPLSEVESAEPETADKAPEPEAREKPEPPAPEPEPAAPAKAAGDDEGSKGGGVIILNPPKKKIKLKKKADESPAPASETPRATSETKVAEPPPTKAPAEPPASPSTKAKSEAPSDEKPAAKKAETKAAKPAAAPKKAESKSTEKSKAPTPSAEPKATESPKPEANLRVSVAVLDRLMNMVGELVLERNRLIQVIGSGDPAAIENVASRVDQVTSELQETVMQTRMQSIDRVFSKFPRVVRDLGRQLGKKCNLEVNGKEVELDKTVIEAIGDPLTHLIRNALDHGIESPQERTEAGKDPSGTLRLSAYHRDGKVNIIIEDDGAGIDPEKLKSKAVSKGVITPEAAHAMSRREAIRLIFNPGFSTAEKVSSVSGRGVGMDVVKTNLEKQGGAVEVESEVGRGTKIHIGLPLTLAIMPTLIIRSGRFPYAIPQVNVNEVVRIRPGDVKDRLERIKGAEVFRLRGRLLPLVRLSEVLRLPGITRDESLGDPRGAVTIIVVETGQLRYGIIVDEICDSEEIVVKPLGRHLKDCNSLSGATILGDGRVALILDVGSIANESRLQPTSELESEGEPDHTGIATDLQTILMFSNAADEFFGIPLGMVSRIEHYEADAIKDIGGNEIVDAGGRYLPLLSVERHISARPREATSEFHVAVISIAGIDVGVVVPRLIDTLDLSSNLQHGDLDTQGIMGTVIIGERVVRIIDALELVESACPDVRRAIEQTRTNQRAPVLLAEDDPFFRRQIEILLESWGYDPVTCEDGAIAWNTLDSGETEFAALVTDVIMPNMDGLELCRRVSSDPRFVNMRIISISSLQAPADVRNGLAAGIDEYQIKVDREQLRCSLERHLAGENPPRKVAQQEPEPVA